MPELPEVETVVRGLNSAIAGRKIIQVEIFRPNLRFPFPNNLVQTLNGVTIQAVERRAKFIIFRLNKLNLVGHLGMTGAYVVRKTGDYELQKHDHMLWRFENATDMVYHDPRRFGFLLNEIDAQKMLGNLGVEPFSDDFNADFLAAKMQRSATSIKNFLLGQQIVVGIGNIYASEILFRCKIHPQTVANKCTKKAEELVQQTRIVLQEAIASGGSTLRNYANASGDSGYFQHNFLTYDRAEEPCFTCGDMILRIVQAGRSSFFCSTCQPII
jgi:formamidopyrimidine-DNA glycosylase